MTFDLFPFFNELDVLEIRFRELEDVVDKFVLVEMPVTFTGKPKPLHFDGNRDRFSRWADRITHLMIPESEIPHTTDAWARERYQRNYLMRGLDGCGADDVIIISDVDEIPRASVIASFDPAAGYRKLLQMSHVGYLNVQGGRDVEGGQWPCTVVLPFAELQRVGSIEAARHLPAGGRTIPDAGWHFSWIGGAERISEKMGSFSHTEHDNPHVRNIDRIANCIAGNRDLFGRADHRFWTNRIDDRYPRWLRENQKRFAHLIKPPLGSSPATESRPTLLNREGDGASRRGPGER